jgi:pyruvate carboxylase
MTSQPPLPAIVAATDCTERATGLDLDALLDLEPYWEAVRRQYRPFETGLQAPTGRIYRHEIPGGQLSNLRQQAVAMGLGARFEEVELTYARADDLLGGIIKVTPSSKVVGDLALYVISSGIDLEALAERPGDFDLPDSVLEFLRGELGEPPGGFPQPFTQRALEGRRDGAKPREVPAEVLACLAQPGRERQVALSELLFPGPAKDQREARARYGDVSVLPTRAFFYGMEDDVEVAVDLAPGVRLVFELEAVGEPDARGLRTVLARLNGQLRPVDVRDTSITAAVERAERADPGNPGHIAAPVAGVVNLQVERGARVEKGQPVAVIEAMKMESTVSAHVAGRVERVTAVSGARLEQGDLIVAIAPG